MLKKPINCDLGECLTPNPDALTMPLIDMANIACGGHSGDDESMIATIKLAKQHQVKIGVHPSYADQANFGRINHNLGNDALFELLYTQISHFKKLCNNNQAKLEYVKPHGALYHNMMCNPDIFKTLCKVIQTIDKDLSLLVQAGIRHFETDITLLHEVFADRGYQGIKLIPRSEQNAVLMNADAIVDQYHYFLAENAFQIDTICFHSDNPASIEALKQLKNE